MTTANPAADLNKLLYGTADLAKSATFWDTLKFDPTKIGTNPTAPGTMYEAGDRAEFARAKAQYYQGQKNAIASNFDPGGKFTSAYGSLGSQGGLVEIPGKPGHYTVTRQPAGNKSYNVVTAEYKIGPDGKTLQRVSDWTPKQLGSDTQFGQDFAKAMAAMAAVAVGAGALGLTEGTGTAAGVGAFGEGAGSAGAFGGTVGGGAGGVGAAAGGIGGIPGSATMGGTGGAPTGVGLEAGGGIMGPPADLAPGFVGPPEVAGGTGLMGPPDIAAGGGAVGDGLAGPLTPPGSVSPIDLPPIEPTTPLPPFQGVDTSVIPPIGGGGGGGIGDIPGSDTIGDLPIDEPWWKDITDLLKDGGAGKLYKGLSGSSGGTTSDASNTANALRRKAFADQWSGQPIGWVPPTIGNPRRG